MKDVIRGSTGQNGRDGGVGAHTGRWVITAEEEQVGMGRFLKVEKDVLFSQTCLFELNE